MPRLEFTRKTRRAIVDRANGRCEKCQAALKSGEGEVDHVLPSELGGEATVANGQLMCRVCHRAKTATDVRRIRKGDRQRDKNTPAIRPKQTIKSRGFDRKERTPKPALPPRPIYEPRESGA